MKDKEKNSKISNVTFCESGSGGINTRLSIPKSWFEDIGVTKEERKVIVAFDKARKRIIIQKFEDEILE